MRALEFESTPKRYIVSSAPVVACGSYMLFVRLVKSRQRRAGRLEQVVVTDERYVNVNCTYGGCIYDKQ